MIEIVFSDSAAGSLKCACTYGRGEYLWGAVSVIIHYEDGREATPEELRDAQAREEERARKEWEAAVPMDIDSGDVFGLSLALDQGPIAGDFWQGRRETLERLFSCYPASEREGAVDDLISRGRKELEKLWERAKGGEALRVWYSDQPGDLCGLCWLMAELEKIGWQGELFLVKLPDWEKEDEHLVRWNGWGDVGPGQWSRHLSCQEKAPALLPRMLAGEWKGLQEENAPLRAVISGKLCSVGEDFYDAFLLRVLDCAAEEFHEAALIGQVLGKYPLGMGDGWLALRVEKLIEKGVLAPLTKAPADHPGYHRMLKKL